MTILSNEEKLSVVNQHLKNVEFSKYNSELSLIEENSVSSPNQELISNITTTIAELNLKISALEAEKAQLIE